MAAIFLQEQDVHDLVTLRDAIEVVEAAFREYGEGRVSLQPRRRVWMGERGYYHYMGVGMPGLNVFGQKWFTVYGTGGTYDGEIKFMVQVHDGTTGELLAIVEADRLGQLRTAATTAVAAKYLARPDATAVGIFGAGFQARAQVEGLLQVLPNVSEIKAFSPNRERLLACCDEMSRRLGRPMTPCEPEAVVRGSQVVVTMTSASSPVFDGSWLEPGALVVAAGAVYLHKREIDDTAVLRSRLVVADHKETAMMESGNLLRATREGLLLWEAVRELGEVPRMGERGWGIEGLSDPRTTPAPGRAPAGGRSACGVALCDGARR